MKLNERHKLVRLLITECGFTKEELATKLKISVNTIIAWKCGNRNPNYAAFYILKRLYKRAIKNKEEANYD